MPARIVDLSHPVVMGMATHPGLPGPEWEPFRSRADYRQSSGTDFQIDRVTLVGNTGTYLDSPFHRFADGGDLASVPLAAVADVAVHVVVSHGQRVVSVALLEETLADTDVSGQAVLLHTGGDAGWGTDDYAQEAPFLDAAGAEWLSERRPSLVGIDSVNIDDLADAVRPAHTQLLGEGIYVLEHLTGLGGLPSTGARLHAAPPAWHGVGTWPVRAYALVPEPPPSG